jgi:hypothetical protein
VVVCWGDSRKGPEAMAETVTSVRPKKRRIAFKVTSLQVNSYEEHNLLRFINFAKPCLSGDWVGTPEERRTAGRLTALKRGHPVLVDRAAGGCGGRFGGERVGAGWRSAAETSCGGAVGIQEEAGQPEKRELLRRGRRFGGGDGGHRRER